MSTFHADDYSFSNLQPEQAGGELTFCIDDGTVQCDKGFKGRVRDEMEGSVLKYDDPNEPAVPPETWDAVREADRECS